MNYREFPISERWPAGYKRGCEKSQHSVFRKASILTYEEQKARKTGCQFRVLCSQFSWGR
jgi:hypothetical protein